MGAKSALAKGYEKFLNDAKALGYTGDADVEDVLAFAADNDINIDNRDRVRKAFKAYRVEVLEESDAGVVIGIMDDAGEAEMDGEDEEKENDQDEEVAKTLRSARDRIARLEADMKNLQRKDEARKTRVEVASSSERDFKRLARKGATVFDNAKDAEAFGHWLIAKTALGEKVGVDRRNAAAKALDNHGIKANTTNFTSSGGALVPTEFNANFWDYQAEYGIARRECDVVPMNSDSIETPKNAGGDGGGFITYFTGEAVQITESQMNFASIPLNAKTLNVFGLMSRQLVDDTAVNIGEKGAQSIATASLKREDECLFIGNGTSTYGGINGLANQFGSTATTDIRSVTGGGTMEAHTLGNLHSVVAKVGDAYRTGSKWYGSPAAKSVIIDRLLAAQGGVTWQETANGDLYMRVLGYEFVEVNVMNSSIDASGDAIDLYFGNLAAAASFGDRNSLEVETNPHEFWSRNAIGIKGYDRFDINVHELGNVANSVASPIVALYQT